MNILIPHHWLLEHLKTAARPEEIRKHLSLCGPSIEKIVTIENEPVYDIEVTTNRVDMMSVRGIAREASAILPTFGQTASLKPLVLPDITGKKPLDVHIEDPSKFSRRMIAVRLDNVKLKPSPAWMQKRLRQIGQRPLNNIVDITNYLMWEIGHPVHAFDYDRLTTKRIVVREAKKGERLVTLDEKEHILHGGEVVFDDGTGKIIDLPGIMGTANTVITNDTKHILLLLDSIDPDKIRQASMGLAIRTHAAVLNEKWVDPQLMDPAIRRGVQLYREIAQATVGSTVKDIYPSKPRIRPISLSWNKFQVYTNAQIPKQQAIAALKRLEFSVKSDKSGILASPPSFRVQDVSLDVDLVEEISRIWGYYKFASRLPTGEIPQTDPAQHFNIEAQVKQAIKFMGYTELFTDPLVSARTANLFGDQGSHLRLANPLGEEWEYLRTSLIPALTHAVRDNQGYFPVSLFEMGEVFLPQQKKLPIEELRLTMVTEKPFLILKGHLDALMRELHIPFHILQENLPQYSRGKSALIVSNKTQIGTFGQLAGDLADHLEVTRPFWILDLSVDKLKELSVKAITLSDIPVHEPIVEDITLVLPPRSSIGPIIEAVRQSSALVTSVQFVGTFEQTATLRINFNSPTRQLTQQEVNAEKERILSALQTAFSVSLKT